ncbi:MAG: sulfotransferase family protein [Actinomycetota bacterium]
MTGDVFIVGAPRSGTTWLQAVLSNHPSFASPPETEVFLALGELERQHRLEHRNTGLTWAITAADLDDWSAELWQRVRDGVLAAAPGATRVLEKSPEHARHLPLIRRLAPGARFVLLVRNPVDVVRSTVEAGRGWGQEWASDRVEAAAGRYRKTMDMALASVGDDTLVVRYEDLLAGAQHWAPLLEFLSIEPDWPLPPLDRSPTELARFVTPEGIGTERWRAMVNTKQGFSFHNREQRVELTGWERHYVAAYCSELMGRFGYEPTGARLSRLDRGRYAVRAVRHHLGPLVRRVARRATRGVSSVPG